jgi:hypothetical protein
MHSTSGCRVRRSASRGVSHFCRNDQSTLTLMVPLCRPRLSLRSVVSSSSRPRRTPGQQLRAFGCQLGLATAAAKKGRLKIVLQHLDLLADRSRRHVQSFGGLAEIQPVW